MRETLATILWEGWTALVLCAAAVFLPGSEALTYPAVLWPGLVLAAAVPAGWVFWALAEQITEPLLKMGYEYTSPSIERSVLLRMGFSSIEAKHIVDGCVERHLIAHGAGNVVYRLAKAQGTDVRTAGLALCEDRLWDEAAAQF